MRDASRVTGWWLFAGTMLLVLGTLNVIWGIAAIGDSTFFTEDAKYVLSGLNTWGWVTLLIGIAQLFAGLSLFAGGGFGRWVGIIAASATAIVSLLSISAYPFWSLCVRARDHRGV